MENSRWFLLDKNRLKDNYENFQILFDIPYT